MTTESPTRKSGFADWQIKLTVQYCASIVATKDNSLLSHKQTILQFKNCTINYSVVKGLVINSHVVLKQINNYYTEHR